jgi:glycosyltransferase involved in cell wall biosynthesis
LKVQHPASLGPYHALLRLVRAQSADLIIVHTELPLCIGARLLALGRSVAADFEDWHSHDLLPEARSGRPLVLLARVESTLLREGRYASTTSMAMAHRLAATYNSPLPVVIPNTFPLSAKPPIGPRNTPPAFFWFSQTIGPGRGIDQFLSAWRLTRVPSRLVLLGDVSSHYRNALTTSLPASHQTRLEFHPLVAPSELSTVIARHDIGLALEPSEPENKDLTTSNKLFQYLDAGVAVLATPTAGQREVMARCPDAGLVNDLTGPVVLAANLDALLANPARLAAMGIAARAAAEREFSWEHTAPLLLKTVSHALAA